MSSEAVRPSRRIAHSIIKQVGSTIVIVALLAAGFMGGHWFQPSHEEVDTPHDASAQEQARTSLLLPKAKVEAAGIHSVAAKLESIQATKTVSAVLDYDSTLQLDLRAPVASVVKEWLVSPGQMVKQGAPLVRLAGTDVALARSEIRSAEAELEVAAIAFEWIAETEANLSELLAALEQRPSRIELENQFRGKRLGNHRDRLINSYTEFLHAQTVANRSAPLGRDGVIAGRTAEARATQRDVAATAFKSACEQSEHDAKHDFAEAHAKLNLAKRNLAVAKQRLALLLGPDGDQADESDVGAFVLTAPFDGRVKTTLLSPSTRLTSGETVLSLTNTATLWVKALVHQHDWEALQVDTSAAIKVIIPGLANQSFHAQVEFIGSEVSSDTRAVSLVGRLPNPNGDFRPGMFAWAALPTEARRDAVTVPPSSVQRHGGEAFVFVESGQGRFRRVDVEVGLETLDFVEIKRGVSDGQLVIDKGAFFLKSELLLEHEEE